MHKIMLGFYLSKQITKVHALSKNKLVSEDMLILNNEKKYEKSNANVIYHTQTCTNRIKLGN